MVNDLTLQELAEITRRHPETLRRLARMGQLPGIYRIGARWMISKAAAEKLRRVPKDAPGPVETRDPLSRETG